MWILSAVGIGGASQGPSLAAATSYQALNVRLPQLAENLDRVASALETDQVRPTQRLLKVCDEMATHVLDPSEGDEEGRASRSALNSWYIARFQPFRKKFYDIQHKGVTVRERLLEELREVIADYWRDVFNKPFSGPPSDHPSSVSRDPRLRQTLRPERGRPLDQGAAATLSGNTLRMGNQEMRWSKEDDAKRFYNSVEVRLKMHTTKNLIINYDGNSADLHGLGLLLFTEFRLRLPESKKILGQRHITLVSESGKVRRALFYDEEEQKFTAVDEAAFP